MKILIEFFHMFKIHMKNLIFLLQWFEFFSKSKKLLAELFSGSIDFLE